MTKCEQVCKVCVVGFQGGLLLNPYFSICMQMHVRLQCWKFFVSSRRCSCGAEIARCSTYTIRLYAPSLVGDGADDAVAH
jgi:hypothetical protein